jgi:hypothetical protein
MASLPMCRPARLTVSRTRSAAWTTSPPACCTIDAHSAMLRASSSDTYMSAARKVSAWNLFRVTPNCLRVLRYSAVVRRAVSMAPMASCA